MKKDSFIMVLVAIISILVAVYAILNHELILAVMLVINACFSIYGAVSFRERFPSAE